ncbi:MAG: two-component system, sporulation sensor kinase [Eubacteriales bacterium]|nr:two-component system, sporulation sensor kinase [Eubacteriales bacterium]
MLAGEGTYYGTLGGEKKSSHKELCQSIWLTSGEPEEKCFLFDAIESLPVGIFTLDGELRVVYVNENFARILQWPREELKGKSWEELMGYCSDGKKLPLSFQEILSGRKVVNFPTNLLNRRGSRIPVLLSLYPVRNEKGKGVGLVGTVQEEKEVVTLEEWHRKVSNFLDNVHHGVVVIDCDGRIVGLNRTAEQFMGIRAEDIFGRSAEEVLASFFPEACRCLLRTLKTGQVFQMHNHEALVQGKKCYLDIYTYQLRNNLGHVIGAAQFFRDTTRRRLLEDSIAQAEKLALVGKIAAGLAHEIRNPLTAVRGFLQLMAEKHAGDEKEGSYYRIMLSEIDRINEIINDLLLISRPGRPEKEEVDLVQVLKEVILFIDAQALLSRVDVLTDIRAEKAVIAGGYTQLKNILLNIIQNAFDAMPEGGLLEVTLAVVEEEKNDGNKAKVARVEIRDSGVGIPAEHQPHIFDPFYSTKETGTGLGLTVTYWLVQEIGGKIEFISKEGFGTKFILTFPVIRDEKGEERNGGANGRGAFANSSADGGKRA